MNHEIRCSNISLYTFHLAHIQLFLTGGRLLCSFSAPTFATSRRSPKRNRRQSFLSPHGRQLRLIAMSVEWDDKAAHVDSLARNPFGRKLNRT